MQNSKAVPEGTSHSGRQLSELTSKSEFKRSSFSDTGKGKDCGDAEPGASTKKISSFVNQLMYIINHDCRFRGVTGWSADGKSFAILKRDIFVSEVLPAYFGPIKFESFMKRLFRHGFETKVIHTLRRQDTAIYHPYFRRDEPELCELITPVAGNRSCKKKKRKSTTCCGGAVAGDVSHLKESDTDVASSKQSSGSKGPIADGQPSEASLGGQHSTTVASIGGMGTTEVENVKKKRKLSSVKAEASSQSSALLLPEIEKDIPAAKTVSTPDCAWGKKKVDATSASIHSNDKTAVTSHPTSPTVLLFLELLRRQDTQRALASAAPTSLPSPSLTTLQSLFSEIAGWSNRGVLGDSWGVSNDHSFLQSALMIARARSAELVAAASAPTTLLPHLQSPSSQILAELIRQGSTSLSCPPYVASSSLFGSPELLAASARAIATGRTSPSDRLPPVSVVAEAANLAALLAAQGARNTPH